MLCILLIKVSLEYIYSGTSKKLFLSRNVICSKCTGFQGSGIKVSIRHLGPSMIQQMQHLCNGCKGTGETISDKEQRPMKMYVAGCRCLLDVLPVMFGFTNLPIMSSFVLQPETVIGDIVFVMAQKDHPKFKRRRDDIFMEHTLSLTDALCGFQFALTHLDGSQLLITTNPGEVVKPGKPVYLSLEYLYSGTSKKLSLSRNVIFSKCTGKGSKPGSSMKCYGCQGSGMKVSIRHLGPSMIQQMQHPCNGCKGTGETISDKERCAQCKGDKVVQEKKVLEVHVEKGMQNGQMIPSLERPMKLYVAGCGCLLDVLPVVFVFTNLPIMSSFVLHPETVTGDIVFVMAQKDHPKFKRMRDDIFMEHTLSLTDALCGFQFALTHLDGRQLLITTNPGEVLNPGKPVYVVDAQGVNYISTLLLSFQTLYEGVLPPRTSSQLTDMEVNACEETTLHAANSVC
ncbi:hypothetical protein MKX03_001224 [Papaver bracteatum]|nr:hypothetical protein MKX03_001224 [Papaver bracteatum]